ncbi:hypothetical protein [Nitrosomonas sp.]|uniref:hypothetical protein n=1 Tax=Nitrosomonas sp. TaxID=42353 RepID=UPI0035B0E9B0
MTSYEKLKRDIDTLRESIKLIGQELASRKQLTPEETNELKHHIEWCSGELKELYKRLESGN